MLLAERAIVPDSIHCMDLFDLCRALPDNSADMILCDLPYGVTHYAWDKQIPFEPMWAAFRRVIKPRGAIVLTATEPFATFLRTSWLDGYKYDWVWVNRQRPTFFIHAKNRPLNAYELCLVFSKGAVNHASVSERRMNYFPQMRKGAPYRKFGDLAKYNSVSGIISKSPSMRNHWANNPGVRYPINVLEIDEPNNSLEHPTQKPVALFEYFIRTYTQPGDLVLDPCVGSGTTAVAAFRCDRRYICGDLDRGYVEIARRRVAQADPMRAREVAPGVKQLSLFEVPPADNGPA